VANDDETIPSSSSFLAITPILSIQKPLSASIWQNNAMLKLRCSTLRGKRSEPWLEIVFLQGIIQLFGVAKMLIANRCLQEYIFYRMITPVKTMVHKMLLIK